MATSTDNRFSRERLAGYDPATLERASVLVVGAGALAQNVTVNLALSGVGELRLVDFDEFEDHNAPRSPLYPTPDERERWGMGKARVVAHKALALSRASHPCVRYAATPIQALGAGAFRDVDVVVACVDNPEARAHLSDMCRWLGIALIEGGFDGPAISLSSFPAASSEQAAGAPCYRCGNPSVTGTFSCQRHAEAMAEAGITPAIQTAAATLGGLQAEAAIQTLHGARPLAGSRVNFDIRTGRLDRYDLALDPTCHGIHRRLGEPASLEVTGADTVNRLLGQIACELGPDSSVALPHNFVHDAFCDICGKLADVHRPEWAWRANPRCVICGGPFARLAEADDDRAPTVLPALDQSSPRTILELPCAAAGMPSLDVVEAESANGDRVGAYRLAGPIADLYHDAAL